MAALWEVVLMAPPLTLYAIGCFAGRLEVLILGGIIHYGVYKRLQRKPEAPIWFFRLEERALIERYRMEE